MKYHLAFKTTDELGKTYPSRRSGKNVMTYNTPGHGQTWSDWTEIDNPAPLMGIADLTGATQ